MGRDRYHFAQFSVIAIVAFILSTAIIQSASPASSLELPQQLSGLVLATLTNAEIGVLKTGQPVSKLLSSTVDSEVGVLGATWINAPVEEYVQAIENIEQFESGGSFQVTKRISDPPVIDDFAALQLRQEDVADLKKCRVGNCELKIGADAISRFRSKIHWSKSTAISDVRELFRQLALQYVVDYQRGGNAELEVYRDKHRPSSVAKEFAAIVDEMSGMLQYDPSLRRYLLEYPNAQLSNGRSFFYWQQVAFGLKPTIRINHVAISQAGESTLVASKLVYANHYFRAALELQLLMPDPSRGPGFWLVSVKRMRSDGLNGTGNLVRGRVEKDAVRGLVEALQATKTKFESNRQQGPGL
jgi:hypothetical protein